MHETPNGHGVKSIDFNSPQSIIWHYGFFALPTYNEIDCTTTAPTKGWNLRTRMIFTSQGLIDEKTNLDKNIATNKTYTRLKDDQNETIDDDENGIFNPDIDHEGSPFPEENEDDEDWGVWELIGLSSICQARNWKFE